MPLFCINLLTFNITFAIFITNLMSYILYVYITHTFIFDFGNVARSQRFTHRYYVLAVSDWTDEDRWSRYARTKPLPVGIFVPGPQVLKSKNFYMRKWRCAIPLIYIFKWKSIYQSHTHTHTHTRWHAHAHAHAHTHTHTHTHNICTASPLHMKIFQINMNVCLSLVYA